MLTTRPDAFEPFIRSFTLHLRAENKADKTVDLYKWAARKFADWLLERPAQLDQVRSLMQAAGGDAKVVATHLGVPQSVAERLMSEVLDDHQVARTWTEVTRRHIQAFTADLLATHDKPSYASMVYRALQQFFKWAASPEEAELDTNPMLGMKPPKVPEVPVPVPDAEGIVKMLKGLAGKDFTSRRDSAIIAVFTDTGVRRGELAGIKVDDLDLAKRNATVTGKGSKTRTVRFGRRTALIIDRYLRVRDQSKWSWRPELWLAERGRGVLSASGIYQMIERRAEAAGLGHLHPHQFRHLFAHLWLDGGGAESDLMALMGWSSESMLRRYAMEKRADRARGAHDRLGILDRLGP